MYLPSVKVSPLDKIIFISSNSWLEIYSPMLNIKDQGHICLKKAFSHVVTPLFQHCSTTAWSSLSANKDNFKVDTPYCFNKNTHNAFTMSRWNILSSFAEFASDDLMISQLSSSHRCFSSEKLFTKGRKCQFRISKNYQYKKLAIVHKKSL